MANEETVSNAEVIQQDAPAVDEGRPVESITLRDLDQIAQIIDLASQRGAFKGGELSVVGSLYDKLAQFLGSVKEQQDAAKAAAEAEEAPVENDGVEEAPEEK